MARARSIYYLAAEEPRSFLASLVSRRTVHVESGKPVIVFGAVFAPVDLNTTTYYVWQRYDDERSRWETVQRLTNRLRGGRDKGYRNYSYKTNVDPGLWRVDVESVDGRLIGRTEFSVVNAPAPDDLKVVRL
jgi:hypothetical protein